MIPINISHSKPWITDDDCQAVIDVLSSNMIGHGMRCQLLEQRMALWVGGTDSVTVSSGSSALVLALYGMEVEPGDEVILPSYVCRSVFESVLSIGGIPVLCDVGNDWVITIDSVREKITSKTKVIIVPHMYGIFSDVAAVKSLGIPVIEDCAQAVAGEAERTLIGDVGVFSFHPTKCLTSGEGGLVVSKKNQIIERMRTCRDGDVSSLRARLFSPMSDIAAGLALAQLDRYSQMLIRRKSLADRYCAILEQVYPSCINKQALQNSMFFRFPLLIEGGVESCQDKFLQHGIQVRRGVDMLLHRAINLTDGQFPMSTRLYNTTVSLPIYPALTTSEELHCLENVAKIFSSLN